MREDILLDYIQDKYVASLRLGQQYRDIGDEVSCNFELGFQNALETIAYVLDCTLSKPINLT
jgi:ABC-type transporter MlaC component